MMIAIVNPKSATGRTAQAFARVLPDLQPIEVLYTKQAGDATRFAAQAIRNGFRTIVAVGGDGTINEVVNGFFEDGRPISQDARLAVVPFGTGSDLRRSLKIPARAEQAAALVRKSRPQAIDVVRVAYVTPDGREAVRFCINVTSFGLGGDVAAVANRTSKALGGRASFLIAAARASSWYSPKDVTLRIDDRALVKTRIMNVAVGNGRYHGGGMQVCPRAELDDGLMDVTVVEAMNLLEVIGAVGMLYNGRIHRHPKVRCYQATRLSAESAERVAMEIDGEPLGYLPSEISIMPGAIQVLM